jgi:DtxR family Mn-dependent transcriptional regulator
MTDGFYTMKGYTLLSAGEVTSAMEDYLEMIARIRQGGGSVRAGELAARLHVRPPSVTKMIRQLEKAGLASAPPYGEITLTEKGAALGGYLLYRHDVLGRFLRLVNGDGSELEEVEKIEHFISPQTVRNLERLCRRLEEEA